jgi:hypothetical protein
MTREELENLKDKCDTLFNEIMFDYSDIALPKLYEMLSKLLKACESKRLKEGK